jgi:hypothetical protein
MSYTSVMPVTRRSRKASEPFPVVALYVFNRPFSSIVDNMQDLWSKFCSEWVGTRLERGQNSHDEEMALRSEPQHEAVYNCTYNPQLSMGNLLHSFQDTVATLTKMAGCFALLQHFSRRYTTMAAQCKLLVDTMLPSSTSTSEEKMQMIRWYWGEPPDHINGQCSCETPLSAPLTTTECTGKKIQFVC